MTLCVALQEIWFDRRTRKGTFVEKCPFAADTRIEMLDLEPPVPPDITRARPISDLYTAPMFTRPRLHVELRQQSATSGVEPDCRST